jgi:2-amino-4-hydroxy-6-hydroxymethyldihydropteridine diphosphokinase
MASSSVRVAVALGSNLGDRHEHMRWACERLGRLLTGVRTSSVIETPPFEVPDPDAQGPYLNAALTGATTLSAVQLLAELQALEAERGRGRPPREAARPHRNAARTLDLDLILFGDAVLDQPALTVPHPRFRERAFVLAPLAEVAGDWIDPVTGLTVTALLRRLNDRA